MELYKSPKNLFVAGFIGSPKMNFVEGAPAAKHDAKTIGVRPEHIRISTTEGDWKGTVGVAEHLGSDTFLHVHADGLGTDHRPRRRRDRRQPRRHRLADAGPGHAPPLRRRRQGALTMRFARNAALTPAWPTAIAVQRDVAIGRRMS